MIKILDGQTRQVQLSIERLEKEFGKNSLYVHHVKVDQDTGRLFLVVEATAPEKVGFFKKSDGEVVAQDLDWKEVWDTQSRLEQIYGEGTLTMFTYSNSN